MLRYFSRLSTGKIALWCYLFWYAITVVHYFDPAPAIWLNSVGISLVIGVALILSVNGSSLRSDPWQTFRLLLMPFCVSSFAALIKGRGFVLIFPPTLEENAISVRACALFIALVALLNGCHPAPARATSPERKISPETAPRSSKLRVPARP